MVCNQDLIFLHIPKAGGTSCTDYLCQTLKTPIFSSSIKSKFAEHHYDAQLIEGYSHETLEEIYQNEDTLFEQMGIKVKQIKNIFVVIRHPYELELSNYLFFRNGKNNVLRGPAFQVPHVLEKIDLAQGTFDHFVRDSGYFRDDAEGRGIRCEQYFLLDGEIPEQLTILRAEDLSEEFPRVTRQFRVRDDIPFPYVNKSGSASVATDDYLNKKTKRAIVEKHQWLFSNGFYNA
jgi:hypothetical protein